MRAFVLACVVAMACTSSAVAQSETTQAGSELTDRSSMSVPQLRDGSCNGEGTQDLRNLRFIGCVMFVLGAVEMLREWQRANPAQAPRACVPRNVRSGDLILAVQQYIEANSAWRNNQDATTAVIAALKARWPCS
jgi:hypothetical protein